VFDEVVDKVAEAGSGREPGVDASWRQRLEIGRRMDLVHDEKVARGAGADDARLMTHAPPSLWPPKTRL
jgi:hypothetical protein